MAFPAACVERMIEQWEPLQDFFKSELYALGTEDKETSKHTRLVGVNNFF